jgi:hypothetical protein
MIVAVLGLVGTVVTFARAFYYYRRYLEGLPLPALRDAARDDFPESTWSRYSWIWSLPMLMNLFFDFPPQFPPLARGDWLDVSLPLSGIVFLLSGITLTRYHNAIRHHLKKE